MIQNSKTTDAFLNGLYTVRWYLGHQNPEGAKRVLNGMIHNALNQSPQGGGGSEVIVKPPLFGELIATFAESQIGVREVGNNGGVQVREYQSATWLEPGAWPWCAAFICWCLQRAAEKQSVRCKLPRTAGARDLYNWAKDIDNDSGKHRTRSGGESAGVRVINLRSERMLRGDIIIFDTFSHCGIVRYDETQSQFISTEELITIEGNTNKAGAREGDGVYEKHRSARRGGERVRHAIRVTA